MVPALLLLKIYIHAWRCLQCCQTIALLLTGGGGKPPLALWAPISRAVGTLRY